MVPAIGRAIRRGPVRAVIFLVLAGWSLLAAFGGRPVLGVMAAFVWLELALAAIRLAPVTGGPVADPVAEARVAPILRELCTRAGCPVPRVVLRDGAVRAATVRRYRRQSVLTLSRHYLDRVADPELRALLAHEVVHIVRDDLRAARWRARVALGCGAGAGMAVAYAVPGFRGIPVIWASLLVTIMAALALLGLTNRARESRADTEGAVLVGDPAAMARALEAAHALSSEVRRDRWGSGPWRWVLFPVTWRMPTHPPTAARIAQLRVPSR